MDDKSWYNEKMALYTENSGILRRILEQGKDDLVSRNAARNLNCPPDALKMVLERGKDDLVSSFAAMNPNCSPDALETVLSRGKVDWVSQYAADNPNCPTDTLEMALSKENDDWVSSLAAMNPNCPPIARIKWMMATGKIGKEDPKIHVIEYDNNEIDEDLEKLKALISN